MAGINSVLNHFSFPPFCLFKNFKFQTEIKWALFPENRIFIAQLNSDTDLVSYLKSKHWIHSCLLSTCDTRHCGWYMDSEGQTADALRELKFRFLFKIKNNTWLSPPPPPPLRLYKWEFFTNSLQNRKQRKSRQVFVSMWPTYSI